MKTSREEQLEKALKPFADLLEYPDEAPVDEDGFVSLPLQILLSDIKAAQKMLQ